MPLETASNIYQLVPTNPPDTDLVQQGDDHIRLIKNVIQQTWPSITGPGLPTSTGSANAHIVTHVYGPAAYSAGQIVTFKAGFTNTGPTTINVNGGGPVTLALGGAALAANALVAGNVYTMIYDPALTAFSIIASSGTLGLYLPLIGGTLTGNLAISAASGNSALNLSPVSGSVNINMIKSASGMFNQVVAYTGALIRWVVAIGNTSAESGSDVGSDFTISRYHDAGTFIDNPFTITRSTGAVTVSNGIAGANFWLNRPAGFNNNIVGQTSGLSRWAILLGSGTAESGSNAGSDFNIQRFNDAGTFIDIPLAITRSTGNVAFNGAGGNVQVAPPAGAPTLAALAPIGGAYNANILVRKGVSGQSNVITGNTGANPRWALILGDAGAESGSNAGSSFALYRYNDAGTYLDAPMSALRATGQFTFTVAIVNGPSDRVLKENIVPLEGALDKVLALQGVSFNFIATPDKREIGLIAQDVEPIVPEIVQTFQTSVPEDSDNKLPPKLALDYPKLTALLIEAVKTLTARVEALETQLGVTADA